MPADTDGRDAYLPPALIMERQMPTPIEQLATTIQAVRPMVPAKDFDLSLRFYADLGFQSRMLDDRLAEMTLGTCTFILQDYYVPEWADNFVIHVFVSDLEGWWEHIDALDLPHRHGVKTRPPELQPWGVRVAGLIDPAGVLWRFHEAQARDLG